MHISRGNENKLGTIVLLGGFYSGFSIFSETVRAQRHIIFPDIKSMEGILLFRKERLLTPLLPIKKYLAKLIPEFIMTGSLGYSIPNPCFTAKIGGKLL